MRIDFEELNKQYEANLVDKLRGFGEDEFLKFWVPDTEKVKNILNLIDALYESNTLKVELFNVKLKDIDIKGLQDIKNIALDEINKEIININIKKIEYQNYKKKKNKLELSIDNSNNIGIINNIEKPKLDESVNNFYIKGLNNLNYKIHNNKKYKIDSDLFKKFEIIFSENQKFIYFVNKKNYYIENSFIFFEKENNISKIIDLLSDIIKNKHFQEVAEHSTIYLEHELRRMINHQREDIKGIFLPINSGGIFNLISHEFRKNFEEFKNEFSIKDEINKNYYTSNDRWIKTGFEQQKKIIDKILKDIVFRKFNLNEEDINLIRVVQGNRLEFSLSKNLKGDFEDNKLFRIEEIFKKEIDNNIELITIEEKDANILRLTNAPKPV